MLVQERTAAFGMACITILVDARLFELRRSLKVTLAADFGLRSLIKERRPIVDLGELVPVGGFLHDGVAINASDATARVRTGFPVSLHSPLMTAETRFILDFRRLTRVFTERNQFADALTAACRDVITPRTVAILASSFFRFVAGVIEKNFPHLSLGKFFKLGGVASLANFVTDIISRTGLRHFFFRGKCGLGKGDQEE